MTLVALVRCQHDGCTAEAELIGLYGGFPITFETWSANSPDRGYVDETWTLPDGWVARIVERGRDGYVTAELCPDHAP